MEQRTVIESHNLTFNCTDKIVFLCRLRWRRVCLINFHDISDHKPQKKLLTLHAESHHSTAVKSHTIATMYRTAEDVSSNETNKIHSKKMVDELLTNNGYSQRVLDKVRNKTKAKKNKKRLKPETVATLSIPHLTDQCTAQIRRAAEQFGIPVRIVSKPGKKLKNILTSSKPLDGKECPNTNCATCTALDYYLL